MLQAKKRAQLLQRNEEPYPELERRVEKYMKRYIRLSLYSPSSSKFAHPTRKRTGLDEFFDERIEQRLLAHDVFVNETQLSVSSCFWLRSNDSGP